MDVGAQLVVGDLPRVLLEASILLSVAVLVGLLTRPIHISLTVVQAVAGLLVTELGAGLAITRLISGEGFENLVLNLFLPVLIFEASLNLSTREFMRNLIPVGALATVALAISAVVGVSMNLTMGLSLSVALLFGVIISATDPVNVQTFVRCRAWPPGDPTVAAAPGVLRSVCGVLPSGHWLIPPLLSDAGFSHGGQRLVAVAPTPPDGQRRRRGRLIGVLGRRDR